MRDQAYFGFPPPAAIACVNHLWLALRRADMEQCVGIVKAYIRHEYVGRVIRTPDNVLAAPCLHLLFQRTLRQIELVNVLDWDRLARGNLIDTNKEKLYMFLILQS